MTTPLGEKVAVYDQVADLESRRGFLHFCAHVVIDSRPEPRRFSEAAYPWQWEWAQTFAPALEYVMGLRATYSGPDSFWRTLARGHDKTTGLARAVNYALVYGKRHVEIDVAAADKEQAALLLAAMQVEANLNPWYGRRLSLTKDGGEGPSGRFTVMTSDAPSAAGRRPDLIIIDEVTHWKNDKLWDMLISGVDKRPGAVTAVITNAGIKDSWQWKKKEDFKKSWRWNVYEAPGRLPTWMSERHVAETAKAMRPSEARRLLYNIWTDPAEESDYLTRAEMLACVDLGRERGLHYRVKGERGLTYWAGIDYGPKRDRTALSVSHQALDGVIELDRLDVWQGQQDDRVAISRIREWVDQQRAAFNDLHLVVDTYQLEELCQDYERRLPVTRFEARGGKANYEMAENFRSSVVNRQIAFYEGAGAIPVDGEIQDLVDEVASLITKKMVYGYRFDHDAQGHDDRTVAVAMPALIMLSGPRPAKFEKPPALAKPIPIPPLRNPNRLSAETRGLWGTKRK